LSKDPTIRLVFRSVEGARLWYDRNLEFVSLLVREFGVNGLVDQGLVGIGLSNVNLHIGRWQSWLLHQREVGIPREM